MQSPVEYYYSRTLRTKNSGRPGLWDGRDLYSDTPNVLLAQKWHFPRRQIPLK
jgi:hypothetical protein